MIDPDDPRVPALQLLLGDLTIEQVCALINRAVPADHVYGVADRARLFGNIEGTIRSMKRVREQANGESPLGKMAQENIRGDLGAAIARMDSVRRSLKP